MTIIASIDLSEDKCTQSEVKTVENWDESDYGFVLADLLLTIARAADIEPMLLLANTAAMTGSLLYAESEKEDQEEPIISKH
jgi:hypothetical protein